MVTGDDTEWSLDGCEINHDTSKGQQEGGKASTPLNPSRISRPPFLRATSEELASLPESAKGVPSHLINMNTTQPAEDKCEEKTSALATELISDEITTESTTESGSVPKKSAKKRALRLIAGVDISFVGTGADAVYSSQSAAIAGTSKGNDNDDQKTTRTCTDTSTLQQQRDCGVTDSAVTAPVNRDSACVSLVIQEFPSMTSVYQDYQMVTLSVPYIPGYLAFREVPHIISMFDRLKMKRPGLWPDVVMVDGNGSLHHRACGVACHVGVMLDLPCLGVAKTLLSVDGLTRSKVDKLTEDLLQRVEAHRQSRQAVTAGMSTASAPSSSSSATKSIATTAEPSSTAAAAAAAVAAAKRGCVSKDPRIIDAESHVYWLPLVGDSGTTRGALVLPTSTGRRPLYVSPGHRLSLATAVRITQQSSFHRVPEPIRAADLGSREFIRRYLEKLSQNMAAPATTTTTTTTTTTVTTTTTTTTATKGK